MAIQAFASFYELAHDLFRIAFLAVSITFNLCLQVCEALVQAILDVAQSPANLVLIDQRPDLWLSALANHLHAFLEFGLEVVYGALFALPVFFLTLQPSLVSVLL